MRTRVAIVPRLSGPYAPVPPNLIRLAELMGADLHVLQPGYSLDGLETCSSLLFQGGDDVLPMHEALSMRSPNASRDLAEYAALQRALQLRLRIVGICRGMQLINRYFGGTDAPIEASTPLIDHGSTTAWARHDVTLTTNSLLARMIDEQLVQDCSTHHRRTITALGVGIQPAGSTLDGCVEAIENQEAQVFGVQWHPEDTAVSSPIQVRVMQHLLNCL